MTVRRNRRAGVEELWWKTVKVDNKETKVEFKLYGTGKRWCAGYVDDQSGEHTKRFEGKVDAQSRLNNAATALTQGAHLAPHDAQLFVQEWGDQWILGYVVHRDSRVRRARTHIAQIAAEFGKNVTLCCSPISPKGVDVETEG